MHTYVYAYMLPATQQLLRIRVQPKEDTKTNLATTVASSDSRS